jgi:hypothetical protein
MKRKFGILATTAMAVTLAGCSFSIGGPSQDDIEKSILDNYETEGYENISVQLEPTDEGGYTGEVDFTLPGSGETRNLACTVEPLEDGESSWRCMPRIGDLEQLIVNGYSERGAAQVTAELTADGDTAYTGHVDYADPNTGETFRHGCTVDLSTGDADWQCAP